MVFDSKYRRQALQSLESEKQEMKREIQEEIAQYRRKTHKMKDKLQRFLDHLFTYRKSTF